MMRCLRDKVTDKVYYPQELLNLLCRQIVIRETGQFLSDVWAKIIITLRKIHSQEIDLGLGYVTFLF